MTKPMENSLGRFERPVSAASYAALGVSLSAILGIGAVLAFLLNSFLLAAVFAVSLLLLLGYTWYVVGLTRRISSAIAGSMIEWASALPDLQRQSLNIEVGELSRILEVDGGHINELRSAYIVAEDLALRQLQLEENVPLLRHVCVSGIPFDAVFVKESVLVCCEVAFLIVPELRQERIDAMLRKISSVSIEIERMNIGLGVRLMPVLITQLTAEDENDLRSSIRGRRFSDTPVDVDIRILDFETLQRIYVSS
jgi:hypothetical protein